VLSTGAQAILGCRLDRLTHTQRMVLKVASVIGDEFSFDLLWEAYPFKDKDEDLFGAEIANLIDMKILRRVNPATVSYTMLVSAPVNGADAGATSGGAAGTPAESAEAKRPLEGLLFRLV